MATEDFYLLSVLEEILPKDKQAGIDPSIIIEHVHISRSLRFEGEGLQENFRFSGIGEYMLHPTSWEPRYKSIDCDFVFVCAADRPEKSVELKSNNGLFGVLTTFKGDDSPILEGEVVVSNEIYDRLSQYLIDFDYGGRNEIYFSISVRRANHLDNYLAISSFCCKYGIAPKKQDKNGEGSIEDLL